jgi:hypothetical protein
MKKTTYRYMIRHMTHVRMTYIWAWTRLFRCSYT